MSFLIWNSDSLVEEKYDWSDLQWQAWKESESEVQVSFEVEID